MNTTLWELQRQSTIAAVKPVEGTDTFTELLRQVQGSYVRLSDAETLKLAQVCWEGTPTQQAWASDMLTRNAAPLALECAYHYSTRFGGLLEAWDAALHQLGKLLPKQHEPTTQGKPGRKVGWNGQQVGVRWLTWVTKKLWAEMPMAAERLVDEKRASGAPAAIAAGRNRVLYTVGNDGELYDLVTLLGDHHSARNVREAVTKGKARKGLPKGRKNLIVKRGSARHTPKSVKGAVEALTASLNGKTAQTVSEGHLLAVRTALWDAKRPHEENADAIAHLPVTPLWVAAGVRANARAILRRPGITERTQQDAQRLAHVTAEWVQQNSKSVKLDAVVGNDQDERLSDIIAAPEPERETRFEAELHSTDKARALAAYRRYGPLYGPVLLALPVRELLPVQRRRKQDAEVRERFQAFCERGGLKGQQQVQAIMAARVAVSLLGLDPKTVSNKDALGALRGVQKALRGHKHTARKGQVGFALAAALQGTVLAEVTKEEVKVAKTLRQQFGTLKWNFSLAAALAFGRKLDKQGRADRIFVEACRKAGVRVKLATEALELVKNLPTSSRKGERVRVVTGSGYVRPWQLALEAEERRIERWATDTRKGALELQQQARQVENAIWNASEREQAFKTLGPAFLAADEAAKTAHHCADQLAACSEALEEAARVVNLGQALSAIIEAEAVEYDAACAAQPETWWAQAYRALNAVGVPFYTL